MPIPLYPGAPKLLVTPIASPIFLRRRSKRTVIFNEISRKDGAWSILKKSEDKIVTLPDVEQLYGAVLAPKFEHYHNFLFFSGDNPTPPSEYIDGAQKDGYLLDNRGIVKNELSEQGDPGKLKWFSWQAVSPMPELTASDVDNADDGSDDDGGGDDDQNIINSPKWSYILKNVPEEDYGKNDSFIDPIIDFNSAKVQQLIPFMLQKPGHNNTEGTVHWGLKKKFSLADGGSFYVDIWVPKNIAFKVSQLSKAQTNDASGDDDDNGGVNPFSELIDQTYLVFDFKRETGTGNHYRLELSTLRPPTFYQMVEEQSGSDDTNVSGSSDNSNNTPTVPFPLSIWDNVDSLKLLQGDKEGRLRISFYPIVNNLLITTNVTEEVWVISRPIIDPTDDTDTDTDTDNDNDNDNGDDDQDDGVTDFLSKYFRVAGQMHIYGGNISCGIAFCHINYQKNGAIKIGDFAALGSGRVGDTKFYMAETSSDRVDTRRIPPEYLIDGNFYSSFAGTVDGVDITSHPYIRSNDESKIVIKEAIVGGTIPGTSIMKTQIRLVAGKLQAFITEDDGSRTTINLGNAITPILKVANQEFPPQENFASKEQEFPCARIRNLTLSRELEGYSSARATGQMVINALDDQPSIGGLDGIKSAISKTSYIRIDVSWEGGYLDGETYPIFTGMATNVSDMTKAGERTLTWQLSDYWKILEGSIILNSPYFDGEPIDLIIKYWLDHIGFASRKQRIQETDYHLGISVDLQDTTKKFPDLSNVADAIKKLSDMESSIAYFDSVGDFIYRQWPSVITGAGTVVPAAVFKSYHEDGNVNVAPFGPYSGNTSTGSVVDEYLAYGVRQMDWNVDTTFNQILVTSTDQNNRGFIVVADINLPSVVDPDHDTYLGFVKPFFQQEALFGDQSAVRKTVAYYTRFYKPPYYLSWKTIAGLGPNEVELMDVVKLDGMDLIVTSINHTFDSETQTWDIDWKGEWIYPPNKQITDTGGN